MNEPVITEDRDGLRLIRLNGALALTAQTRAVLLSAIEAALNAPDITAIVLTGTERGFCPGLDITEYDGGLSAPTPARICDRIEQAAKPVAVAIEGTALGAGMELALAAHMRFARIGAQLGLPDVQIGLPPGAGATQRLPRLIGAGRALEILLSGKTMRAEDPLLSRVLSAVTQDDPVEAACAAALKSAAKGSWARTCDQRHGFSDPIGYQTAIRSIRAKLRMTGSVEADIIQAVEAAQLLPFAQGQVLEQNLYEARISSADARAQRHYRVAEGYVRRAARSDAAIEQIVVLGGASARLAALCLTGTAQVRLNVTTAEETKPATKAVITALRQMRPTATNDAVSEMLARLCVGQGQEGVEKADLVLDGLAKPQPLQTALKPDALWVVLRSGLAPEALGDHAPATRYAGLHMHFDGAQARLAELAALPAAGRDALAQIAGFFDRLGVVVLRCRPPAGYSGGRLRAALDAAACQLVAHGASPYEVDDAARSLGFGAVPFQTMDREGLRQAVNRLSRHAETRDFTPLHLAFLQGLAETGRHGRSAASGVYTYEAETAMPDTSVTDSAIDTALGDAAAGLDMPQLERALLCATVTESARLLDEGAVARPSDLDVLMVRRLGYRAALGGPLMQADLTGMFRLYQDMKTLQALHPLWAPNARLETMVKSAQGFFGRSVSYA